MAAGALQVGQQRPAVQRRRERFRAVGTAQVDERGQQVQLGDHADAAAGAAPLLHHLLQFAFRRGRDRYPQRAKACDEALKRGPEQIETFGVSQRQG